MTPLAAFDSPQVSLLKKESPVELGTSVVALLLQLTQVQKCAWHSGNVAFIAKMLTNELWALRFDELIYIFRRGLSGGFGKVTWAELQYSDLSEWCQQYFISPERLEVEELYRNAELDRAKDYQKDFLAALPEGEISKLADLFRVKKTEAKKPTGITPDKSYFDQKHATEFENTKHNYTDEHLQIALEFCVKNQFTITETAIRTELLTRTETKENKINNTTT